MQTPKKSKSLTNKCKTISDNKQLQWQTGGSFNSIVTMWRSKLLILRLTKKIQQRYNNNNHCRSTKLAFKLNKKNTHNLSITQVIKALHTIPYSIKPLCSHHGKTLHTIYYKAKDLWFIISFCTCWSVYNTQVHYNSIKTDTVTNLRQSKVYMRD